MELVDALAPPEIAEQVKGCVKFSFDAPSSDYVTILITVDHPILDEMVLGQV